MIKYSSNTLMPYIPRELYEDAATEFLQKYCSEALDKPMAIPIEEIIQKKLNLTILYKNKISNDKSIFGLICFKGGKIPLFDEETNSNINCFIEPRTVIVDISSNNAGLINNTLAHEAIHYFFHRKYFLLNHNDSTGISCGSNQEIRDKNLELIERQARAIAPRILMPIEMVKKKAEEYFSKPWTIKINENIVDWTAANTIEEVALFFNVSRLSAYYRLKELGYDVSNYDPDAQHIYSYYKESKVVRECKKKISADEVYKLYMKNENFRKTIDSGAFEYIDNEFVFKDDSSIKLRFYTVTNTFNFQTAFYKTNIDNQQLLVDDDNVKMAIKTYKTETSMLKKQKSSFNKRCRRIMEKKSWAVEDFREATGLSRNIYSQINNNDESNFSLPIVMAILVGLQMNLTDSLELLRLQGHALRDNSLDVAYKTILMCHLNIDEANQFLINSGFGILGTKRRKKEILKLFHQNTI